LTKLRHPPPFHAQTLLYALAQPALVGCMLGCGPIMLGVVFFYYWFMSPVDGGTVCSADPVAAPSALCLQDILDWEGAADLEVLRMGRQQLAIFAIGFYCSVVFAILVMPDYTDDDRKTDVQRAALAQKTTLTKSQ
jgi:hypothetical protein